MGLFPRFSNTLGFEGGQFGHDTTRETTSS
jgi:hypothetical protein